jgi:hypothetical protein
MISSRSGRSPERLFHAVRSPFLQKLDLEKGSPLAAFAEQTGAGCFHWRAVAPGRLAEQKRDLFTGAVPSNPREMKDLAAPATKITRGKRVPHCIHACSTPGSTGFPFAIWVNKRLRTSIFSLVDPEKLTGCSHPLRRGLFRNPPDDSAAIISAFLPLFPARN